MSPALPRHRLGVLGLAALVLSACSSTKPAGPAPSSDPIYGQFDDFTQSMAKQIVQTALERRASGDTESWRGSNGETAQVTPLRSFRILTGHYCRDFNLVMQGGRDSLSATRTACRSPEGEWIDVTAQKAAPES